MVILHINTAGAFKLEQATVDTWRIGWNFSAGEQLTQAQDIFTADIDPVLLAGSAVQLESYDVNNTVRPFQWTAISFLARKALQPNPSNPFQVPFCPSSYLSSMYLL